MWTQVDRLVTSKEGLFLKQHDSNFDMLIKSLKLKISGSISAFDTACNAPLRKILFNSLENENYLKDNNFIIQNRTS